MQVKDLTTEELKALIRETVMAVLEEVLDDFIVISDKRV